jgi:hypothetical protein
VLPQIQHWTRNTSSTFTEYELLGAILKSVPKLVELSIHIYYRPCVCVGTAHPFLIFFIYNEPFLEAMFGQHYSLGQIESLRNIRKLRFQGPMLH